MPATSRRLGRTRQVDPETLEQALRLYDDGVPVPEIEQRVNITRSAFYRWGSSGCLRLLIWFLGGMFAGADAFEQRG